MNKYMCACGCGRSFDKPADTITRSVPGLGTWSVVFATDSCKRRYLFERECDHFDAVTSRDPEPFTCCTSRLPGILHTFECEESK